MQFLITMASGVWSGEIWVSELISFFVCPLFLVPTPSSMVDLCPFHFLRLQNIMQYCKKLILCNAVLHFFLILLLTPSTVPSHYGMPPFLTFYRGV